MTGMVNPETGGIKQKMKFQAGLEMKMLNKEEIWISGVNTEAKVRRDIPGLMSVLKKMFMNV